MRFPQHRSRQNNCGLGSSLFARRYWGNRFFFLLLSVLRCFSSRGLLHSRGDTPSECQVAPFGYPRIYSCLQIPAVFRSLPRPSSPPEAKASPGRPILLSLVSSRESFYYFITYDSNRMADDVIRITSLSCVCLTLVIVLFLSLLYVCRTTISLPAFAL